MDVAFTVRALESPARVRLAGLLRSPIYVALLTDARCTDYAERAHVHRYHQHLCPLKTFRMLRSSLAARFCSDSKWRTCLSCEVPERHKDIEGTLIYVRNYG